MDNNTEFPSYSGNKLPAPLTKKFYHSPRFWILSLVIFLMVIISIIILVIFLNTQEEDLLGPGESKDEPEVPSAGIPPEDLEEGLPQSTGNGEGEVLLSSADEGAPPLVFADLDEELPPSPADEGAPPLVFADLDEELPPSPADEGAPPLEFADL